MAHMMQKTRCEVMMRPLSCVQETEMLQVEIDIIGGAVASGRKGGVVWRQRVEDGLWLASACFILFYGDFRSNFFWLLAFDSRIRRAPLVYGVACLLLDCFLFPALLHSPPTSTAKKDSHAVCAIVACLAVAAFVMYVYMFHLAPSIFTTNSILLWPLQAVYGFVAGLVCFDHPLIAHPAYGVAGVDFLHCLMERKATTMLYPTFASNVAYPTCAAHIM